jgi:hypothetical protein
MDSDYPFGIFKLIIPTFSLLSSVNSYRYSFMTYQTNITYHRMFNMRNTTSDVCEEEISTSSFVQLHFKFFTRIYVIFRLVIHEGWNFTPNRENTCIISLRVKARAHRTSLTLPLFNEVSVPSEESERSCICVLEVSIFSLSTILLLDFVTVLTMWYIWLFILLVYSQ